LLIDGYASGARETEPYFNARRSQLADRLSKVSARLAIIGVLASSVITFFDRNLSSTQKIGQISSWLFAASVFSFMASAIGVAIASPVVAALVALSVAVALSIALTVFVNLYFSLNHTQIYNRQRFV